MASAGRAVPQQGGKMRWVFAFGKANGFKWEGYGTAGCLLSSAMRGLAASERGGDVVNIRGFFVG